MMGFFSSSSPFDEEVRQATDGMKEDWQRIMRVCDKVNENTTQSSPNAKLCLASILTRLKDQDPHVTLQAITLLNACVHNCGKNFLLVVASRDFEKEFRKLLDTSGTEVRNSLLAVLKTWAEGEFKKDSQLNLIPALYNSLRKDGSFSGADELKSEKPKSQQDDYLIKKEEDELTKAIELSLKETASPKGKSSSASSSCSGLYPSASLSSPSEGRKVRALYDFEAAEDNELTFKAGELLNVIDDSDANWWKGQNKRGEGLFPSSFVTADLSLEPEQPRAENKKTVQFDEAVRVKKISKEEIEIDESKMDRLLHYLLEADPTNPKGDPSEMRDLVEEVNAMGPLIDAELESVDSKHAQLSQLCMDLVEAINLYHSLMKEPTQSGPSYIQKPMGYIYGEPQNTMGPPPPRMLPPYSMMGPGPSGHHNGPLPSQPGPSSLPPSLLQHQYLPPHNGRPQNGLPMYGPPQQSQIPPGMHPSYQPGAPNFHQNPPQGPPHPNYQDNQPLL